MSTISATAVSAWPTPTVSTSTVSNPAASHSRIASRVRRATPPARSPAEDGRINAAGDRASSVMRVLSPRMAPPPRFDAGSTASTAIAPAELDSFEAKAFDEGRFAGTRRAGNADANGTSRVRQQRFDEPLGFLAMIGAGGFDQSDGAGERPPIALPQSRDQLLGGHAIFSPPRVRPRAARPPAGGPTSRRKRRGATAAPGGRRARRSGRRRARGSRRRRRSSTAGAR